MFRFFISFACTTLCLANPCWSAHYSMLIQVDQKNQTVGEATYDFWFSMQGSVGNSAQLSLISPDGTRYDGWPAAPLAVVDRSGLPLNELNTSFLGNWTFEETFNAITKSYQIALPQVPSELFDISVPVITSPADGDIVGKVFDLTWTHPDLDGYSISASSLDPVPTFRNILRRNGPGDYTFHFDEVADFTPIHFSEFSIVKRLPPLNVEVTDLTANADASFGGRSITFEVHSPSISFTVVPEPTSVMLLGVAAACATGGRGLVRNTRSASPGG